MKKIMILWVVCLGLLLYSAYVDAVPYIVQGQGIGVGIPGGTDTNVLFVDGAALGQDGNFTWTKATDTLGTGASGKVKTTKIIAPADSTTAIQVQNAAGSSTVMDFDTSNLRVGIGTTSPGYKLHVGGSEGIHIGKNSAIYVDNTIDSVNTLMGLDSGNYMTLGGLTSAAGGNAIKISPNGGSPPTVYITHSNSTSSVGFNTTSFGTSAAKTLSIGEGTAPTTSPADVSQLWSANQNGAATNALYYRNESGQSGVVAHQAPLVNLLSNSGFGVWSQGTVTATATGAAPVTDGANAALTAGGTLVTNGGVDSDTTGWTGTLAALTSDAGGKTGNMLTVTNSGAAIGSASQSVTTVAGKLYQVSVYFKKGSATGGRIKVGTALADTTYYDSGTITDVGWTAYTKIFEATTTTTFITLDSEEAATNTALYDSITLHEITPGCIAVDTKGPDGWSKPASSDAKLHREQTTTKEGSFYSLKASGSSVSKTVSWSDGGKESLPAFYKKFAGKTVTLGCWVYTGVADVSKLNIVDSAGSSSSSTHSGDSSWQWLEVSRSIASGITSFRIDLEQGWNTAAYFSQPMLVFGPSIGQGNYSAPPGEIVWTDAPIASTTFNSQTFSDTSATSLNIEADSSGKIPKGVKALYFFTVIRDSASLANDCYIYFRTDATQVVQFTNGVGGKANDSLSYTQGWQKCDSNGDVQYVVEASGSNTLDITTFYTSGIQVN